MSARGTGLKALFPEGFSRASSYPLPFPRRSDRRLDKSSSTQSKVLEDPSVTPPPVAGPSYHRKRETDPNLTGNSLSNIDLDCEGKSALQSVVRLNIVILVCLLATIELVPTRKTNFRDLQSGTNINMPEPEFGVIIVGAGVVGLTASYCLEKAGIEQVVLETC
ncbi:unnamed protein product [Diplocarpon coronariae]|uniref:Uncharacterized protein n=1 Tax=Diplocarpon coronariae TaxID=2795749 RepID=A0A218Z7F7_9HELO|nr:hypothetical protein B2J93_4563 [Marssonina coronariae]